LRFLVEWQDDAPNAAAEERATVGDIQVLVDNRNVCLNLRNGKLHEHVTLALYPLADGLSREWWNLFGGRDSEVKLVNHRSGFAVPDIRLSFDGVMCEIHAEQAEYNNPEVRFWGGATEIASRKEAETQIGSFIELVLERLHERKLGDTGAKQRWARVLASRKDPDEASFCEAAGALGLDPYQIEDEAAYSIERAAEFFSEEPLNEFLAGARNVDQGRLLDWVKTVEERPPSTSYIADAKPISQKVAEISPLQDGLKSWALGYRRARALRKILGLTTTSRIKGYRDLAKKLGASSNFELASKVDGIRLLREDKDDGAHFHLRTERGSQGAASYLFTFARGVGDVVCFPEKSRAPVNDLRSAFRQSSGRAFAAEFLAPIDEIQSMMHDGKDRLSIADEFTVSPITIDLQIENARRISEACAA